MVDIPDKTFQELQALLLVSGYKGTPEEVEKLYLLALAAEFGL